MRSAVKRIIGVVAAISTLGILPSACASSASDQQSASNGSSDSARRVAQTTREAGGEVAHVTPDTTAPGATHVKWLSDANILSLLSVMNGRQLAAANMELQAWHSDTVRSFASTIAHDYGGLQHSVDSLAEGIKLAPVAPALATNIVATMQAPIDSISGLRNAPLDRAFVQQQITAQQFMSGYIDLLSADAERPEITALLSSASARVSADLEHAKALHAMLVVEDSVAAADSAAKRAARHHQSTSTPR